MCVASTAAGYHIFFQLLGQAKEPEFKDFGMQGPESYSYVKDCQRTAPGIDDAKEFDMMKAAFTILKVGDARHVPCLGFHSFCDCHRC